MKPQLGRARTIFPLVLFFIILLLFVCQLFSLQVVRGADYRAQSQRKIAKSETVEAARGEIVDRNGIPLVSNRVSWQLRLDTAQMGERKAETLDALTALCRREGIAWADTLPLSTTAPYVYNEERRHDAPFVGFLEKRKLASTQSGPQLLDALAEAYALPDTLTPQARRDICGILYELDLRRYDLNNTPYLFAEDLSVDFIAKLKEHGLPGLSITAGAERAYNTTAAAHLLGRVGRMNEGEWAAYKAQGYSMDARVGKDGLERAFEAQLHGTSGLRTREYDTDGVVVGEVYTKVPEPGKQLRLTLDLALQEKTEQVLAERIPQLGAAEGAAVAMLDVRDGSVLALASYPTFDPITFSDMYDSLQSDPRQPLFNRALQGLYAPGSTYKMVTAVAGLEEGVITPDTQILDTGRYTYYRTPQPRCWIYRQTGKTHGLETVSEAITDSCNIFFYDLGRRLGIDRLDAYARKFGLGEPTGIELPGEATGVIAGPAFTASLGQTWYEGNTLSAAIGQENNSFTPLQLASYVATLVNGGTRYQVHLQSEVRSNDGREILSQFAPNVLGQVTLQPETLAAVKEGMLAVTQSGSVAPYFSKLSVPVGAKTGSAQVTGNEHANAVFVCFAPYDNPEVCLAIVAEKGGSGSELGRIAAEILDQYFNPPEPAADAP